MKKQELSRKLIHIGVSMVLLIVVYIVEHIFNARTVAIAGFGFLLLVVSIDMFRLEFGKHAPGTKSLMKDKEKYTFNAFVFSIIAAVIVFGTIQFEIAFAALAMSALADPAANIVGQLAGRKKIPFNKSKTIEGTGAHLLVSLVIGVALLFRFSVPGVGLSIAILMAIVATITEFFSDLTEDNFTVPIFTAFAGQLLFWLF